MRFGSALLVCAVALTACHKDADEDLRKSTRSWRASLALVQSEETKKNVSAKYVKQVGELASKSLSKEIKKPEIKPETRRDAEAVIKLANEASQ